VSVSGQVLHQVGVSQRAQPARSPKRAAAEVSEQWKLSSSTDDDTDVEVRPRRTDGPVKPLQRVKILIVEDDHDTRDLLVVMLSNAGAEVEAAACAADALALLPVFLPAAIVSDVGLPGMNGYAFMESVRKLEHSRGGQTPSLALTAFTRPRDRSDAMAAGFDAYMSKPVLPDDLIAAIVRLLVARP
jgi:CheY-like chemotaxis protein